MSAVVAVLLAVAVIAALLGALALTRLAPLARIHAASFVGAVSGGCVTLAAVVADGATSRSCKAVAIYAVMLLVGALSSHATGRAIHLRGGERR